MAETTTRLNVADISSILWFDANGTRKTLPVRLKDGTIEWTVHWPDMIETQDQNGEYLSGRDGGRTGRSEVKFSCDIFDVGDHSTEATFPDLVEQDGYVAASWTSTDTTQSGERKKFGLEIVLANRNSAGALKGCTLTWPMGDFVPPATYSGSRDGFTANGLTWRSTVQKPTKTRTS